MVDTIIADEHDSPVNNDNERHSIELVSSLGQRPTCFSTTTAEVLFVLTTTMSIGMTSMVAGGLMVVTSHIARDLDMNNAETTWITAAPSLAAGSFLLFFGKLADITSRRWQFIGSMFVFAVLCLGTGFAQSSLVFDVLNGLLGLVGAASVPPAVGTLGAVYTVPSKRKNYAFACFSGGNPLGFALGSIACGVCTHILSWRAYFFFVAIVYAFLTIIAYYVTPVDHGQKESLSWATLKTFDFVGTFLTIAGFGLLSASLTLAGDAPDGWQTSYVIATLTIGIVLILIFLYWETRATSPLLPMWVWKDRDFSFQLLILFLGFGAFYTAIFWTTLYIQRFWTASSLMVAVYTLPMAIVGGAANVVAGMILHRVSSKLLMFIAIFCYVVAFLLLGLNRDGDSYWYFVFWAFGLGVMGADFQFNVVNMYTMTALDSSQQSTGGSIYQMVSRLAVTIILGVTTAIYNAMEQHPPRSGYQANQNSAPYSAVFFFCTALCGFSLLFVPFLRVGTQGGKNIESNKLADTENQTDGGGMKSLSPCDEKTLPVVVI